MELTGQEKAFSNVIGSCRIMEQCVSMVEAQKDYLSAPMVVIALVQISRLAEQNRLQRNWAESPLAERALPILTSKLRGRCDEWEPRALSMAILALAKLQAVDTGLFSEAAITLTRRCNQLSAKVRAFNRNNLIPLFLALRQREIQLPSTTKKVLVRGIIVLGAFPK